MWYNDSVISHLILWTICLYVRLSRFYRYDSIYFIFKFNENMCDDTGDTAGNITTFIYLYYHLYHESFLCFVTTNCAVHVSMDEKRRLLSAEDQRTGFKMAHICHVHAIYMTHIHMTHGWMMEDESIMGVYYSTTLWASVWMCHEETCMAGWCRTSQ